MKIYYENHLKEKIDLDSENIILQYQELFDYSWDATTSNEKITGFERASATIPVTVAVTADTKEEYVAISNRFHEAVETDISALVPGTLYVGEYYLKCYISGDKKTDAFMGMPFQIKNLTVVTDYPFWCRDKLCQFHASKEQIADDVNKKSIYRLMEDVPPKPKVDYPRDYPYGYTTRYKQATRHFIRDYPYKYYRNHTIGRLDNDHFVESDFRMIVYGPCTHPDIRIKDNLYQVNTVLYDGEYMVVDSRERTAVKYARNGVVENLFNRRGKENYLFQKIPPGKSAVKWNAQYPFDVVLYQERSEPPWNIL